MVIATQDDPLVVAEFFRVFLPRVPERHKVSAVIALPGFSESIVLRIRRFARLYGFLGVAKLAWRYLIAKLAKGGVRELCSRYGVRYVNFAGSVKSAEFRRLLRSYEPDLLVSVSAPQVFGKKVLAIPRLGAVNLHSAPLPRYGGMLPSFWILLNDEKESAVTLHYMTEEVDRGPIIAQKYFQVPKGITQFELMRMTKRIGAELLLSQIDSIAEGRCDARPMPMEQASYFGFPTAKDIQLFRKSGKKLI